MNAPLGIAVLVLFVYALAVMRLTRLINGDRVLDRMRLYPARKLRDAQTQYAYNAGAGDIGGAEHAQRWIKFWDGVVYLIGCPWCVSMWVALGTVWAPLWFWDNGAVQYLGIALAVSHLAGVFARFADTEEIEIEDGPGVA